MRAIIFTAPGGPEVLKAADLDEPAPGPGQVRIKVAAAAVNPVDVATRSGALADAGVMPPFGGRPSVGLGWDVAGTVAATGPDVTAFGPGDQVVGLQDRLDVPLGTYADAVVLDAAAVARAPRTADPVHAATLPLNGLTAWQALDLLDLPAGATLLVTGAAGGVGGYAVELAARRGLRVVATASAADEPVVRGLGADRFVPRGPHLADAVRGLVPGGVDGALDAAVLSTAALDAVRGGGAFVSVIGGPATPPPLRGIDVRTVFVRADGAQLARLVDLVDAGHLTLRVAGTLPLADVADAHARFESGGVRGRLVLTP